MDKVLVLIKSLFIFLMSQSAQTSIIEDNAQHRDDLMVSYTEKSHSATAIGFDQGINIKIFQTGDVYIIIPGYMKHAGHYYVQLEQEKLEALRLLLVDDAILTFDAHAVRERVAREQLLLKESQGTVSSVSDKSDILLEISPGVYPSPNSAEEDGSHARRIIWSGLRWDAEQFPEIKSLQALSAIQAFFLLILEREDLQSIDQ